MAIRPPAPGDAGAFLACARASRRLHGRWVAAPTTPAAFAHWQARVRQAHQAPFLVCDRSDGSLVGVINLNEIVRGAFQNAFVGYYGFAGATGEGCMTEGLRLVVRHAFEDLRLHRLEANIQPENERSIALVRRAGFEFEGLARRYLKIAGRWRDHEHWVRLRS